MALRRTCLYKEEIIGIESIYTVVNGKQINIEKKVEQLRKLGREGKLFCPCGCGRNLIVVAGEKQLREQHFRIVNEEGLLPCDYKEDRYETEESIHTKIVLKCWLDEKLRDEDLKSRVPISAEGDTERKFEYSFLSEKHHLGIVYSRDIQNLKKEKIELLEAHKGNRTILCFTSIHNFGLDGQYPENFVDIMERQGYCLGITCEENDYAKAELTAILFFKTYSGIWEEVVITHDLLSRYTLDESNELYLGKLSVRSLMNKLLEDRKRKYQKDKEAEEERQRLREERRRREEERKRFLEEQLRKEEERRKQLAVEIERERKAEEEKRKKVLEDFLKEEEERQASIMPEPERKTEAYEAQRSQSAPLFVRDPSDLEAFKEIDAEILNASGKRLYLCAICHKIRPVLAFSRIEPVPETGDKSNRGLCRACSNAGCPECGRKLVRNDLSDGAYYTCSDYPACRFAKKIF